MSKKTDGHKAYSKAQNKVKYKETEEKQSRYYLAPIFLVLCILPFIVRLKYFNSNLSQYSWYNSNDMAEDLFLYYKQWFFVAVVALMAILIGVKAYLDRKAIKFLPILIPLAIYASLALLSAIFSKSRSFSFLGGQDQFESVFALIGYGICVYYTFLIARTEEDVKTVMTFLSIQAIIMILLGISQFVGHDFFGTEMANDLIIPSKYNVETSMVMGEGRIYLSLYNPNYVGVYTALITPIFLIMLFFQKNKKYIVIYACIVLGLILCTFGSQSLAGALGFLVSIVCICVFMWRYLVKHYYVTLPVIVLGIIGFLVMNMVTDNYLWNKFMNSMGNSKTYFTLTQMDTNEDNVSLTYKDNKLYVEYLVENDQSVYLNPKDENGNVVAGTFDEATNSYILTDERFLGLSIGLEKENPALFFIQEGIYKWYFTNRTEDRTYYHLNRVGRLDKMVTAPSAVFTGFEALASWRGYIWSRTIPLLKDYLFLGSGPDTYVLAFPQQDYLNMANSTFRDGLLTKPHCLYLQIAIQTGMLSLIAFLVFYAMYFISSIRLYIKGRFNNYYSQIGVAIFIGTIGYMVTGLTNDSSITTAPIFWTLIGLGIAANYKVKQLLRKETASKETGVEGNGAK